MSTDPRFRYHPDPVATGSAEPSAGSDTVCSVCRSSSEQRYTGPVFGRQAEWLCLGCIASGEAARALAIDGDPAEFTDAGWGVPEDVPAAVVDEIAQRTPGFTAWQQEHWMYHCSDGAAYLGPAGWDDLTADPEATAMLREELREAGQDGATAEELLQRMSRDGEAMAQLFRCLHCDTHLAYVDLA